MKARLLRISISLIMAVLLMVPVIGVAAGAPSLPHRFYGSVAIDSVPAPVGTVIEARMIVGLQNVANNGAFNPITIAQVGKYGDVDLNLNPPQLLVQGNIAEGATVEFFVNGVKANETAPWHSGLTTQLNLTAGAAPTPVVATVSTVASSGITADSVVLNGNLTQLTGAASANVSFDWGTSQVIYGNQTTVQTLNAAGTFTATLSGLLPDTIYHYRARAVAGQMTILGTDLIVRTAAVPVTAVAASTGVASGIAATSAVLNGNLTQLSGAASATASFQWGTTLEYNNETPGQTLTATGTFIATLTGLLPGTLYHYRAKAVAGPMTVFGTDQTFTTSAASGGGGGGGGGSGSGAVTPTPTPTPTSTGPTSPLPVTISGGSVQGAIDSQGSVQETVKVESKDGKVTLGIGKGTKVADKEGKPLAAITGEPVAKASAPPPPPGQVIVGQPMQFGPDGATFNPPLELVMSYAGETLPPGVTDDRLIITWWNGKTWEIVGGIVNPVAKTVTAAVSHFSMFALTALPPTATTQPSPSAPVTSPTSPPVTPTIPSVPTPAATTPPPTTPASTGTVTLSVPLLLGGGILIGMAFAALLFLAFRRRKGV